MNITTMNITEKDDKKECACASSGVGRGAIPAEVLWLLKAPYVMLILVQILCANVDMNK